MKDKIAMEIMNRTEAKSNLETVHETSAGLSNASLKFLPNGFGFIRINELPVPYCRIDVEGYITECNDLLEQLSGTGREELVGRSLYDLMDQSSRRIMEGGLLSCSEVPVSTVQEFVWLKGKEGNAIPVSVTARPIRNASGRTEAYNLSIRDESSSQKKIAKAEKERDDLRKKELLQEEFIAVASHELRTPIQPILGYALLAKMKRINDERAWDYVLTEARRLQQLANDILDVSRIDSGALEYNFKPEKINEIMASIVDSVKMGLTKPISLQVKFDSAEADIEVDLDKSRIVQVLTNLLGNALKFTDSGSVVLESKIHYEKNHIEIFVSDTGKGIPAEIQPILFEKFATKGHGDASLHKGTGLGLYICKAIIGAHNGRIFAFNNENGGATFRIVLPISQD